eukprot:Polyplicarium_translucidae@DN2658_c0_g1_i2.p2
MSMCEEAECTEGARVATYSPGDVAGELLPAVSRDISDLEGLWELLPRSDSIDAILQTLGVGAVKRAIMKKCTPKVLIKIESGEENQDPHVPSLSIVSLLPMGTTKSGAVRPGALGQ